MLASILQASGYRVGLFTSPHLVDFRERIRVDGQMIDRRYVASFVEEARAIADEVSPSFFELTTMMALCYFRDSHVDVAIIEVGLGGRLDSTNIISPVLSVITNISLDHTQLLGSTVAEIASEKAGIIKPSTPVVVGNSRGEGVRDTLEAQALSVGASIHWAEISDEIEGYTASPDSYIYMTKSWGRLSSPLTGAVQPENVATVLESLAVLPEDLRPHSEAVRIGLAEVLIRTGLRGRWEILARDPLLICDTGHNEAGLSAVARQLGELSAEGQRLHIVLGMVSDKDVRASLAVLPTDARYYFTAASVERALAPVELATLAHRQGLVGDTYPTVAEAVDVALSEARARGGVVFVGGSNFVVADLLQYIN